MCKQFPDYFQCIKLGSSLYTACISPNCISSALQGCRHRKWTVYMLYKGFNLTFPNAVFSSSCGEKDMKNHPHSPFPLSDCAEEQVSVREGGWKEEALGAQTDTAREELRIKPPERGRVMWLQSSHAVFFGQCSRNYWRARVRKGQCQGSECRAHHSSRGRDEGCVDIWPHSHLRWAAFLPLCFQIHPCQMAQ